ncbi:type IV pilus biogenesis/stability protein PilW [Uliginosibacterium sp. H3]|uniref:Type IV pilus biogenesis/stability protein PilW n=1 Tax=Uliginosibacterium silvisoli TaxID=3114758 RepID=A0ABU6K3K2_9RHOO|nr:type IV pilus biogenesis/stability protein PilW [Uliginosibacterium sp. H3]
MNFMQPLCVHAAIVVTCLLAGCASLPSPTPGYSGSGATDRSSSDMPATTEARNKARVHIELGAAYMEGNLGAALDEARVAVAYDKTYAPGYLLMGQVYALLEQYAQAQDAFEESLRLAPGDPEVNTAYGWFLCNRGRQKEGAARLEQAARNPYYRTPGRAWTNLGLCNLQLRDDVAAEVAFLRADQADPDNLQAKYHIAAISYRNGNFYRAREYINVLNRQPGTQTAETIWLALRIENKLGNRDAVQRYGNQLARNYPASNENQAYQQGKFE